MVKKKMKMLKKKKKERRREECFWEYSMWNEMCIQAFYKQ